MSSRKLERWIQQKTLPQRLLLSGGADLWPLALSTAAQLLGQDLAPIQAGLEADVKLCPDQGTSLKIGESQNPESLSVRGLVAWLNQTPVAHRRVLVLQNLERTSRDAMQAWLKILEEPPARAQFILTSQNHHRLPTTILSRLTVLPVADEPSAPPVNPEAHTFLTTADLITQFQCIETLDKAHKEDPQSSLRFMSDLLTLARRDPAHQSHLPILFNAHQDLARNVNRRLVLEHLALQLQNR